MLKEQYSNLEERWDLTLQKSEIEKTEETDLIFADILNAYNEINRFYHTADHLVYSFDILDKLFPTLEVDIAPSVEMALWFHDYYYDEKPDGERRSAIKAIKILNELGAYHSGSFKDYLLDRTTYDKNGEVIEKEMPKPSSKFFLNLFDMICRTNHQDSEFVDRPTRILLDVDLAILAADENIYDEYAKNIRKEYSWCLDKDYYEGRKFVLNNFLNRHLFRTKECEDAGFEKRAKGNIRRELVNVNRMLGTNSC